MGFTTRSTKRRGAGRAATAPTTVRCQLAVPRTRLCLAVVKVPMLGKCPGFVSPSSPALPPPRPLEPVARTSGILSTISRGPQQAARTPSHFLSPLADAPPLTPNSLAARAPMLVKRAACASSCSPALLPPRPLELAALTSGIRTTRRRGPLLAAPTSALLLSRPADAPRMTPSWHAARVPMLVRCPACASSSSPALLPPHPLEPVALTSGIRTTTRRGPMLAAPTTALFLSDLVGAPPLPPSWHAARVLTQDRRLGSASSCSPALLPPHPLEPAALTSGTRIIRQDTVRPGAPTSALLLSQQADAPPMTLSLRAARVPTRVRRPERASASFLPLPPQVQRKVADWMSTTKVQRRIMH